MNLRKLVFMILTLLFFESSALASTSLFETLEKISKNSNLNEEEKTVELNKVYNYLIGEWGSLRYKLSSSSSEKNNSRITEDFLGKHFNLDCTYLSENGSYSESYYQYLNRIDSKKRTALEVNAGVSDLTNVHEDRPTYKFFNGEGTGLLLRTYTQTYVIRDGLFVSITPFVSTGAGSNQNTSDDRQLKLLKLDENHLLGLLTEHRSAFKAASSKIVYCRKY